MKSDFRLALATAAAMSLAVIPLITLLGSATDLILGWTMIAAVGAVSLLASLFANKANFKWLSRGMVAIIQAFVVVGLFGLSGFSNISKAADSGPPVDQLGRILTEGVTALQQTEPPIGAHLGVKLLICLAIGLLAIVADVIVVTGAIPAWSALAIFTPFTVAALVLPEPQAWWFFVAPTVGYLLILATENGVLPDTTPLKLRRKHAWAAIVTGAAIGIPLLAITILVGLLIPPVTPVDWQQVFQKEIPTLQINDPSVNLQANLNDKSERVVLTYQTSSSEGVYLRQAALSNLTYSGFKLSDMSLKRGPVAEVPGVGKPTTQLETEIKIIGLDSEYLLAPYAPISWTAKGGWRYDPATLTVVATDEDRLIATRNLSYVVHSELSNPSWGELQQATVNHAPSPETLSLPEDLPNEIPELARNWTKDAETAGQQALALESRLRDSTEFHYSSTVSTGVDLDGLVDFLTKSKSGYCTHFASSMAVLARTLGIPSRVAVGFTPGEQIDGWWTVKLKNYHAWPELYFEELGWVAFEPTAAATSEPRSPEPPPPDSAEQSGEANLDEQQTGEQQAPAEAGSNQLGQQVAAEPVNSDAVSPSDQQLARNWWPLIWTTFLVVVALAVPGLARAMIRCRRLSGHLEVKAQIHAGWDEIHDTFIDVGTNWPSGTPLVCYQTLGPTLPAEIRQAFKRVCEAEERARYAKDSGSLPETFLTDVATVRNHQISQSTVSRKMVSTVFPASVWARIFG